MDLRGIATFGFGVIIPLSLIPRQIQPYRHTIEEELRMSAMISLEHTLRCNTPTKALISKSSSPGMEYNVSPTGDSTPTRVSSCNDVMNLNKALEPHSGNMIQFTDILMRQVVEKAEMGRVIMEMDEI
jgi:hypothetical protein